MAKGKGTKLIAQNKKAYHDYFMLQRKVSDFEILFRLTAHIVFSNGIALVIELFALCQ
mgnify:CR=1 FL=1